MAAEAIGYHLLETMPDRVSNGRYRLATVDIDINVNTLRPVGDDVFQYTTCCDTASSTGVCSMSNAADGMVLLFNESDDSRCLVRNDAGGAIPFSSLKLCSDRELAQRVVDAYTQQCGAKKNSALETAAAHPDNEFLRRRFVWRNNRTVLASPSPSIDAIEPLCFWGSSSNSGSCSGSIASVASIAS